ncbi:MAG: aminopeptidase [Anaerolineales bacterium]|nr:aminopeptidase [Anaerolineales bacterium]
MELPAYEVARFRQMTDERWARLALVGPEFPDAFDAVAPQAMRTWAVKRTRAVKFYTEAQMANRMQWCVAAVPTPAWAARVFPDLPVDAAIAELWRMIFQFVRVDQPDPVAAWGELNHRLKSAADYLHHNEVRAVHFFDPAPGPDGQPATNLTIGLAETARWIGGASTTPAGAAFQPNMPSEEIFSAPHRRHVEGYVRPPRPRDPMQREVDGAYFRFENGAIVEYHAERGEDVLAQFLAIEGAKHLGEVALVDVESPIFRSGRVFYEILFDENAACHIAFGEAYPECIEHGDELSPEAQEAAGLNRAETHVDFMIGTPTMHIHGITATGDKVPIMENGRFVAAVTA